jgi:hypothetical protein
MGIGFRVFLRVRKIGTVLRWPIRRSDGGERWMRTRSRLSSATRAARRLRRSEGTRHSSHHHATQGLPLYRVRTRWPWRPRCARWWAPALDRIRPQRLSQGCAPAPVRACRWTASSSMAGGHTTIIMSGRCPCNPPNCGSNMPSSLIHGLLLPTQEFVAPMPSRTRKHGPNNRGLTNRYHKSLEGTKCDTGR